MIGDSNIIVIIASNQMTSGVVVKRATAMIPGEFHRAARKHIMVFFCKMCAYAASNQVYLLLGVPEVEEHFEDSGSYATSIEAFKMVCLDKDVLYTALVTMDTV